MPKEVSWTCTRWMALSDCIGCRECGEVSTVIFPLNASAMRHHIFLLTRGSRISKFELLWFPGNCRFLFSLCRGGAHMLMLGFVPSVMIPLLTVLYFIRRPQLVTRPYVLSGRVLSIVLLLLEQTRSNSGHV